MNRSAKIFVAGHRGLVGSAIARALQARGYVNLLLRGSDEVDLRAQAKVDTFFRDERPEVVFLAAARVGGIHANNTYPADFIRDNLQIQLNVIDSAYRHGASKLVFLGSSCIYPRLAPQPMREEYLLTGSLEPTNEWYAVAKIAGLKMCQAYRRQYGFDAISLMPTNLYGPGDNFSIENSHVLPALIRRFHEAKLRGDDRVVVWGTGSPLREFLHVDDLASATVFLAETYSSEDIVNVGTGQEVSIARLAHMIAEVTKYDGEVQFDSSRPDGTPRKLLDVSRLASLGWRASVDLAAGLAGTYDWYVRNVDQARRA